MVYLIMSMDSIGIFIQQVSRLGFTKGSILTIEAQIVPSKWYHLLALGTCIIDRNSRQNTLASIRCRTTVSTQIGPQVTTSKEKEKGTNAAYLAYDFATCR
jgi:hypothetical protein